MAREDFNALRLKVRELVKTPFRQNWQFRLEIDGAPTDLDLYVKDVTYGPTEIETEPIKAGSVTMTWPVAAAPVTLSITVRDNEDGRVAKWFDEWAGKVVNKDGTVNLPDPQGNTGYVKKVKVFALLSDGGERVESEWGMYPTQRGDVTQSREDPAFVEFPVTLMQFRT